VGWAANGILRDEMPVPKPAPRPVYAQPRLRIDRLLLRVRLILARTCVLIAHRKLGATKDCQLPKQVPEEELLAVEEVVRHRNTPVTGREIADALQHRMPRRTLQFRLRYLVDAGRLVAEGSGRWTKYRSPPVTGGDKPTEREAQRPEQVAGSLHMSTAGTEIRTYLRRPPELRKPVGFNRGFLAAYRPNVSHYLSPSSRRHLSQLGNQHLTSQPAGTYARKILDRLLIDLSWNSSRLEGNTYSLHDTRRLIQFGEEAEGHERHETQMILNHKEAIDFLVGAADEIGFNRYTILNLHAILANNLLSDESAAGRLRYITVAIEKSAFYPVEVPQVIEECFDELLAKAAAINDPFEQALFVMVHLPYLQPFDDVNKRTSRLAANIPFIQGNLPPLSFSDVPRSTYIDALLGVYELNKVELMSDVFVWAYERSAARYAAIRQSLGEPDPFRLAHRDTLRQLIGEIVRGRMGRKSAAVYIASWTQAHIAPVDQERFRDMAETELLGLHEGNFARQQLRPSEFAAWQRVWNED
jgi:hypothetical protein